MNYNIIASTDEETVVAEYVREEGRELYYQSEDALEKEFIKQLKNQSYEYIDVKNEEGLTCNLRQQLELLNDMTFSDEEWNCFFKENIAGARDGIVEKTRRIQTDHVQILKRDDGSFKNIYLLDKKNIHNNRLQVLNQYEESQGTRKTRYDVTVLVNGLPLIHVELKRRGVDIREAFNQIKRYQRDSFWASSGLFEYVQIFVISNGTQTKYYSNTTRDKHINEDGSKGDKKTSNSFEFTSFWADGTNKTVQDLMDFTKTFFAKHTILKILTHYCVFTAEDLLLVMRPYQIVAAERILNRITISTNYKKAGTIEAGGYIWHTTGSGKTLTSFKAAQLATNLPHIDKVIFVVDRKDLDYQTMKEYDKYEKNSANSNDSTAILKKQLGSSDTKIIITTIQKLDRFISKNKAHDIYKKHVVLMFDECHRSQFGEMHSKIIKAFKNYHIFGFTGTPIFAANAGSGGNPLMKTTEQAFGERLHTYTIVNAINEENVLPFRVDYINTVKMADHIKDKKILGIDVEKAMGAPERIREITKYIIEHFDQKTKRNSTYSLKGKRLSGFNSIFAVSSIPMAMKYYVEFTKQLEGKKLNVATIFSFNPNEQDAEDTIQDESFDADQLDKTSRDFLDAAIRDYNKTFNVNFDTSKDKFSNYYKDISEKVKSREIDILIVVNMFLTGFDATTLNTLWVDKNLQKHGLIQAFSRTNRILNSIKTFGNIVCFRDLKERTDEAIALFGNKDAGGIVLLKTYEEYYNGYEEDGKDKPGYREVIARLEDTYPLDMPIIGEQGEKDFIRLFGAILKLKNILTAFDDFAGNEILSQRDFQDYQSIYLDLHEKWRPRKREDKENINDDIIFELELIKQIEVNIDYIIAMVIQYYDSNCTDKDILIGIHKAIDSSFELRSKKVLIENFIRQVNVESDVTEDWRLFVSDQQEKDLVEIIETEGLKSEETRKFVASAFQDGMIKTTGVDFDKILPPMTRFSAENDRGIKKEIVEEKLLTFFEKYVGLV